MKVNNEADEEDRLSIISQWEGRIVSHFKGNLYLIIDTNVINTETNERMIYYKALYDQCRTFVRPAEMFVEKCSDEQYEKYGQKYRFELYEMVSRKK